MNLFKNVVVLFLILAIITFFGCNEKENGGQTASNTSSAIEDNDSFCELNLPVQLEEGISITDAYVYTGAFPEDGSFDQKENVFALKVKNYSVKDLQLIRIEIKSDVKDYYFEITTLPSGESITVLEKSGATIAQTEKIQSVKAKNIAFFNKEMSLHSAIFQLTPLDKVMNIMNISDKDISSDVYVYYKKVDQNGNLFGGITFRSNAGPLKSGEMKQIPTSAFSRSDSKAVFITYVQE
jgi:hypothetical protein